MRSIDILAMFLNMFPNYIEQISKWSPNGKNQVKITLTDHTVIKFTYRGFRNWRLETVGFEED